jgi:subtilisin family serine protease
MNRLSPLKTIHDSWESTMNGAWHLEAIGLHAAQQQFPDATGQGVTVAVIDQGIDTSHMHLFARVWQAWEIVATQEGGLDCNELLQPDNHDQSGHGTSVAGVICCYQSGVAREAQILSISLHQKAMNYAGFLLAIERLLATRDRLPRVVNISLALVGTQEWHRQTLLGLLQEVVAYGILPVVCVGNRPRCESVPSPGNLPVGLAVGAVEMVNGDYQVWDGSLSGTFLGAGNPADGQVNGAYNKPDLVAPGTVDTCRFDSVAEHWVPPSGTSFAAPIVTGVAALILQLHPWFNVAMLEYVLRHSCLQLADPQIQQGEGLIQVDNALHLADQLDQGAQM